MKIALSGVPGSGKTTLAELLGKELGLPYIPEPLIEEIYLSGTVGEDVITNAMEKKLSILHDVDKGVFDTLHGGHKYIYCNPKEQEKVIYEPRVDLYDYVFLLDVHIEELKRRIKLRSREELMTTELSNCLTRWIRFTSNLIPMLSDYNSVYVIDGDEPIEKVLTNILRYLGE